MLKFLLAYDERLFLYLNSYHNKALDEWMLVFSHANTWIPVYVLLASYLLYKFKFRKGALYILYLLISVGISDFVTSGILKPLVQRPRPCHVLLEKMILVGNCGGQYGFVSSHAANSFALAMGVRLIFGSSHKSLTIVSFIWASIVAYSRVYLGVHYPCDIICGGLIGMLLCYLVFRITRRPLLSL